MKWCVANGRILDPSQNIDRVGDLWIENGKILGIDFAKEFVQEYDKWIDATDCFVSPGFIDLHVHLRDPGETYKEDIESGCLSAGRGGYTTICCMPNTIPVIDNVKTLAYIDEKAEASNGVNVLGVGAISKGQAGVELSAISDMINCETRCKKITGKGICALSEDGKSLENNQLYLKAMKEARKYDLPIFSHAEGGENPHSPEGELQGVLRDLKLVKEEPCRLHFCHISTKESLEAIVNARNHGLDVSCEVAPHHFSLVKKENEVDGNYKMNPPLRSLKDREAIKEGLRNGSVQVIATDHAPHSVEEKEGYYEKALNGIIGLETALPIAYTELVKTGCLSPMELVEKMSFAPSQILGIYRGTLRSGAPADITIFGGNEHYQIDKSEFKSKSRNTPFDGMWVYGSIIMTIINGKIIYSSKILPEGKEKI